MKQYKSREALDAMLADLEANLPAIIEACKDDDDFDFCVFARSAKEIDNCASPAEREYVHSKIQCMLGAAGLIPSDNEGESCVTPAADSP